MPRQTGKSTTAAGYLLWYAMFVPDSTILVAAHKYTGAQEIMQRIRYAYELCPNHIRAGATSYNKNSLEFENGSRIVACFGVDTYGELTKYMQVKHKADVGILINTADKSVKMIHFTQNTFNFNKFANILELKAVKNIATGLNGC